MAPRNNLESGISEDTSLGQRTPHARVSALNEALQWVEREYWGEGVGRERVVLTWPEARRSIERWATGGRQPKNPLDARSLSADLSSAVRSLLKSGACGPRSTTSAEALLGLLPEKVTVASLIPMLEAAKRLDNDLLVDASAERVLRSGVGSSFPSDQDDDELYLWAKQLDGLVAERGHEPRWVLGSVQKILDDDLSEILSRTNPDLLHAEIESRQGLMGRKAGLPLDDRLDLACEAIAAPPHPHDVVVWLYLDNARDSHVPRQVGPITFYDGQWWDSVISQDPADPRLPDEARSYPSLLHVLPSKSLGNSSDYVLARVDLGRRQLLGAVETAKANTHAVVTLAQFWGPSTWELWEGHIVVVDGHHGGWSLFHSPDNPPGEQDAIRDGTSETLGQVEERLRGNLPISDPRLDDFLAMARAVNTTRRSPPDVRLLLSVRAIEFVAQSINAHWTDILNFYRLAVGLWRLADEIVSVVYPAVKSISEDHRERFLDLNSRIVQVEGPLQFSIDIEAAVLALPEVVELVRPEWTQARRLELLALTAQTPSLAADKIHLQAEAFPVIVSRARRIRNALTHGGPTEVEALRTVDGLTRRLAVQVVHDGLSAAMEERELDGYLESLSTHYEGMVQSLAADDPLGSVLVRRLSENLDQPG